MYKDENEKLPDTFLNFCNWAISSFLRYTSLV